MAYASAMFDADSRPSRPASNVECHFLSVGQDRQACALKQRRCVRIHLCCPPSGADKAEAFFVLNIFTGFFFFLGPVPYPYSPLVCHPRRAIGSALSVLDRSLNRPYEETVGRKKRITLAPSIWQVRRRFAQDAVNGAFKKQAVHRLFRQHSCLTSFGGSFYANRCWPFATSKRFTPWLIFPTADRIFAILSEPYHKT